MTTQVTRSLLCAHSKSRDHMHSPWASLTPQPMQQLAILTSRTTSSARIDKKPCDASGPLYTRCSAARLHPCVQTPARQPYCSCTRHMATLHAQTPPQGSAEAAPCLNWPNGPGFVVTSPCHQHAATSTGCATPLPKPLPHFGRPCKPVHVGVNPPKDSQHPFLRPWRRPSIPPITTPTTTHSATLSPHMRLHPHAP